MNPKKSLSLIAALMLTLASAIAPATNAQADTTEGFVCKKSNGTLTTIYQDSRREKPFIRWTSDFGGLVKYTREKRCQEVTNRLNYYIMNQRPFYMTHGRSEDGKYPIICRTDENGGGCKGLIYTLDPNGRIPANDIVKELLEIVNPEVGPSIGVPATSCPLYVNVRLYLQGKPSAKYVCRAR
ncbi:MAG: COP23 domain-containing protein [Nostoc sp. S4]|nr:COP23 domain-containing protein [Nostoc sp. S4]